MKSNVAMQSRMASEPIPGTPTSQKCREDNQNLDIFSKLSLGFAIFSLCLDAVTTQVVELSSPESVQADTAWDAIAISVAATTICTLFALLLGIHSWQNRRGKIAVLLLLAGPIVALLTILAQPLLIHTTVDVGLISTAFRPSV